MNKDKSSSRSFCFSPPVMLATLAIEFIGAIYVFLRYKSTRITNFAIAILVCLGIFQLAEFFICEAPSIPGLTWARIGHVAITLLPPLGISLAISISGKPSSKRARILELIPYIIALIFTVYFIFISESLNAETCSGNYVIFESAGSMIPYGLYYYGLLIIGIAYCLFTAKTAKDKKVHSALQWLAIGYFSFILPTTTINLIDPTTVAAIPSIMCGFAVLLAIILIFAVLPKIATLKKSKSK